jgi:hypothetical protein
MSRLRQQFPFFKFAPLATLGSSVADSSITSAKIEDSAIVSADINDCGILTQDINDSAITFSKIQGVTAARLLGRYDNAAGIVQEIGLAGGLTFDSTTGTISSDTTIAATINDSQVDSSILADSAVSTAAIQDSAVTSAELGDTAVITAKINAKAVTYAKIQDVASSRILGRTDTTTGVVQEVQAIRSLTIDSLGIQFAGDVFSPGAGYHYGTDTLASRSWLADTDLQFIEDGDCRIPVGALADSVVTTAKIDAQAVTNAKLGDTSVTITKINDAAVTTAKLGDTSVTTAKINNDAVTYAKIQDVAGARLLGRVDGASGDAQEITLAGGLTFDSTAGTISSDTTIAATLTDSQVDSSILADGSVSTVGLQDSAVTTAKIDADAITNAKIADSAVDSSSIADSAVSFQNIQTITAQRLLGRYDNADGVVQEIPLSAELRFDSVNDWMEIADCGVLTNLLKDSSVSTVKLLDSAVDSTKLADSAVSSAGIQDGTIVAADFYDTRLVTRIVEMHVTDTTLATGDTQATFFVPAELDSYDLVRAEAAVKVISTSGRPTIQLRDVTGAADMMSVKISIDSGEKTSYTSDTASVVDTTNDTVVTGQEIAIDIDSAGTGTQDLYVILSFRKP